MEIRTELVPVRVDLQCNICQAGTMQQCDGVMLMSNPPKHPHKCSKCGYETHVSGAPYPRIEYRDKKG